MFDLRLKCKSENNEILQEMVKLIMNSIYGQTIGRDIEDEFCCKTEQGMKTEYDERVKDYWKLPNGDYIVQLSIDEGVDTPVDNKNTMPSQLGAYILSISKRIMNNFVEVIDGFKTNNVFYQDTDSLYIAKKHWDILNEAGYVGSNLLQAINDFNESGIFFGLFLAPKIKYCLTVNEYGVVEEHKTFKGFGDVNRLLDSKKFFEMQKGKSVSGSFPLSWKKSFEVGVVIPVKDRFFKKCDENICEECMSKTKQFEEFEANLNELKRQPPNAFNQMLPYYVI